MNDEDKLVIEKFIVTTKSVYNNKLAIHITFVSGKTRRHELSILEDNTVYLDGTSMSFIEFINILLRKM